VSDWWAVGYPGGPMVDAPPLPRPLYSADAAEQGHRASAPGPDVVATKRTVSRAGRWPWSSGFSDEYTNQFAHGKPGGNVADSGVAGVQRQGGIDPDTGWIGTATYNLLRSIRIPEGLPHAGEPAMDAIAVDLLEDAWEMFGGSEASATDPRERAMEHMAARVGYTEDPPNSNCDYRPDGIRTSQDHCAGGGTWLRGQPWCGCWCYYALEAAGVYPLDSSLASVASIEDQARAGSLCFETWTTDRSRIRPGDLVVVGGYGQHVEMVRGPANGDGSVPTYGGNTSPGSGGSQSNGGGAYERVRYPSEIRGFALVEFPGK